YILNICQRIPGQEFDEPPTEEEALSFIRELGHSGEIKYLTDVIVDHQYQPWRTFASIINKCLCERYLALIRYDSQEYKYFEESISSEETPSKKKPTKAKKDVPSKKKPTFKPKPTKKKAPVEADRGKGLNVLSEVALSEAAQLKEDTKRRKKDFHISQASGSGDGTDFESGVPNEQQHKTSGADEGTGTKPRVLDVPKYLSERKMNRGGDSNDDESNDDNSDEVPKDDDEDDVESDANDDNEASDSEKTKSDEDKNLNLNPNDDEEEEKEEDDDVNVRSKVAEHEEVGKGDAEMIDTTHESTSQENSYEQVIEDAHVTLTSSQKTEGSKQSSSVSSDFASKFLNLDNVPPVIDKVASMMNFKTPHEESSTQAPPLLTVPVTAIPKTSTIAATTVPLIIQPFSSIPHMTTPTPSYTSEFEKKAQAEKEKYIDIIEKSMKKIIKDEVKIQLSQILPKEISDFATPVIQSTINKSLENVVLAKSSSQPQSTYEAAASLTEFEVKKILLDKLEKSKSNRAAKQHRDLYDALVKSYQLDNDIFDSYGKTYSLKRCREDKDKDEDPPAGSDQGLKKRKTSKDAEPSRGSKSKESKSSSFKGSKS
ncbi:hypothetical protein Tco_0512059, partial [Tanacetum coccineum]